jgi:hypothetical protein
MPIKSKFGQLRMAPTATVNWKPPGRGQIANFWFMQLTATHKYLATLFNTLIKENQILKWLMAGVTMLIPKNANSERPKNYRPVICLPTIYKTITFIIGRQMQNHIDGKNLKPKEQRG